MLENCPNFDRVIDAETARNYSVNSIRHSFYYFPWNEDHSNMFSEINKRWRIIKFLGGFNFIEYEKNTPLDGQIDRIHFCLYLSGIGKLATHSDSSHNQRLLTSICMSKRGVDYQEGGFYLNATDEERVEVKEDTNPGDMGIAYATVKHGVNLIDPGETIDWDSNKGRWFIGLFTNDSDEIESR